MSKRTCTTAAMICGLAAMAVLAGCGGDSPAPVAPTPEASIKQLTATDAVYEANPIYAPDGSAILFESDATGNREIWLLPTNGAAALQLTDNAGEDTAPFWLPDGSGFVLVADPAALTAGIQNGRIEFDATVDVDHGARISTAKPPTGDTAPP